MSKTRCLFRVLNVTGHYDGTADVGWAPTYATRDGVVSEENKSYFRATPSGSGTLKAAAGSAGRELCRDAGPLAPGSYAYLDLYDPEEAPEAPKAGQGCRTAWVITKTVSGSHSLNVTLTMKPGVQLPDVDGRYAGYDNGINGMFAGRGHGHMHGTIEMSVDNEVAWPSLAMSLDEKGRPVLRPKVIDILWISP